MKRKPRPLLRFEIDSRLALILLAIGLSGFAASRLSSEYVTLTGYYPAPSGVYTQMLTTSSTTLARNGGTLTIGSASPSSSAIKVSVWGGMRLAPLVSAPTAVEGALYYNSNTHKFMGADNTGWRELGGSNDIVGPLIQPTIDPHSQSVFFNLAGRTDVMVLVYSNVAIPNSVCSMVNLALDGVSKDNAQICDAANSGGATWSVATLTFRSSIVAGNHMLTLSCPSPGSFGLNAKFYVYKL